jgi:2-polyprenyl-6-methoxyphenol hydroxylase-like FAD-dependent oxidoreductase
MLLTVLDRGQGLNNALEDASRLLTELTAVFRDKSKDQKVAIAEYEVEVVARGGLEVEITAKQARAAHNWKILMESPMFKHGANKTK